MDPEGTHLELCPNLDALDNRHTRLRQLVASIAREAGISGVQEPRGILPGSDDRPDILLYFAGPDNADLAIDVGVACPLAASIAGRASTRRLAAAVARERIKRDHYAPQCLPIRTAFSPAIVESFGALGPGFAGLLTHLADRILIPPPAVNWAAPTPLIRWRQLISVAVQRETAAFFFARERRRR